MGSMQQVCSMQAARSLAGGPEMLALQLLCWSGVRDVAGAVLVRLLQVEDLKGMRGVGSTGATQCCLQGACGLGY